MPVYDPPTVPFCDMADLKRILVACIFYSSIFPGYASLGLYNHKILWHATLEWILLQHVGNESPDQPAHMHSLIRALVACLHNQ